jgi:heat-inducible transcriptional repressor
MLDERKSEIIRALIDEHIRTGEPVSSRAILEVSGLSVSTATVRNDLTQLETEGYVLQPHTSAGRVPTTKAYRYYVDHVSPQGLRHQTSERIDQFFSSVHLELSRLLKSTTTLLSEITRYPSVVMGPGPGGERMRGIHLVQQAAQAVLVVLVSDAGRVSQQVASLPQPVKPSEIEMAERFIRASLEDKPLADPTTVETGEEVPGAVRAIVDAVMAVAADWRDRRRELYVGGTSQMPSVWEDLSKIHSVLELLEREAALLQLLADIPVGTAVRIGREIGFESDVDMAIVSTSYTAGGESAGRVGVIGPMRMDYRRAISAVEEVRDGLSERLGSSESGDD